MPGTDIATAYSMRLLTSCILAFTFTYAGCGAEQSGQDDWQAPDIADGKYDGLSPSLQAQYACETADGRWKITADIPVATSYSGTVHLWQSDFFGPGEWGLLPIGFFGRVNKTTAGEHKINLRLFDYENPGSVTFTLEESSSPEAQLVGTAVLDAEENPSIAAREGLIPAVIEFSSCTYRERS